MAAVIPVGLARSVQRVFARSPVALAWWIVTGSAETWTTTARTVVSAALYALTVRFALLEPVRSIAAMGRSIVMAYAAIQQRTMPTAVSAPMNVPLVSFVPMVLVQSVVLQIRPNVPAAAGI